MKVCGGHFPYLLHPWCLECFIDGLSKLLFSCLIKEKSPSLIPKKSVSADFVYDAALDKLFSAIIEAGIINYNMACDNDSTLTATNYLKRERNYYGILKNHWNSSLARAIRDTFH